MGSMLRTRVCTTWLPADGSLTSSAAEAVAAWPLPEGWKACSWAGGEASPSRLTSWSPLVTAGIMAELVSDA